MVPYILSKEGASINNSNIESLYWPILIEIPSEITGVLLMDSKLLGRKYTLFIALFMTSISLICVMIFSESYFILFITCAKFFISISFGVTITYSTEVYNSDVRVIGMSMCNFFCRSAGVIMPAVGITLYDAT